MKKTLSYIFWMGCIWKTACGYEENIWGRFALLYVWICRPHHLVHEQIEQFLMVSGLDFNRILSARCRQCNRDVVVVKMSYDSLST